ncbi:MAG: PrsW family glutamic-type intramembrane protease [Patescibacteria group bacterium]
MISASTIIYALLGGLAPALIWLAFWLREDHIHPEPRMRIFKTFLAGSAAVILVLPLQKIVDELIPGQSAFAFLLWASLEEAFKWGAAYFVAIRSLDDNEPLDPMVYMIVAALGFVALENALFIFNPLLQEDIAGSVITGNLRFIGASLLHTVSSSIIGTSLAFTFYRTRKEKFMWGFLAFLIAILVHTIFNLFIIEQNDLGTFLTFGTVWAGITLLILMFEKVKTFAPPISTADISPSNLA